MRILFCPKAGNLRSSSCTLTSTAPWLWLMHKTLTHPECKFINLWILHTQFFPLKHNLNMSCVALGSPRSRHWAKVSSADSLRGRWSQETPVGSRKARRGREASEGFVFKPGTSVSNLDLTLPQHARTSEPPHPGSSVLGNYYTSSCQSSMERLGRGKFPPCLSCWGKERPGGQAKSSGKERRGLAAGNEAGVHQRGKDEGSSARQHYHICPPKTSKQD